MPGRPREGWAAPARRSAGSYRQDKQSGNPDHWFTLLQDCTWPQSRWMRRRIHRPVSDTKPALAWSVQPGAFRRLSWLAGFLYLASMIHDPRPAHLVGFLDAGIAPEESRIIVRRNLGALSRALLLWRLRLCRHVPVSLAHRRRPAFRQSKSSRSSSLRPALSIATISRKPRSRNLVSCSAASARVQHIARTVLPSPGSLPAKMYAMRGPAYPRRDHGVDRAKSTLIGAWTILRGGEIG
jgi:hypothetical protein